MTKLITILGGVVASSWPSERCSPALNTMYPRSPSAAAKSPPCARSDLRAAMSSFILVRGLAISFVGGAVGCVAVLPLNGLTTSTMNFQTFSSLAFAFKITLDLLVIGIIFALVMGILGGLLPAIRAALQPVSSPSANCSGRLLRRAPFRS